MRRVSSRFRRASLTFSAKPFFVSTFQRPLLRSCRTPPTLFGGCRFFSADTNDPQSFEEATRKHALKEDGKQASSRHEKVFSDKKKPKFSESSSESSGGARNRGRFSFDSSGQYRDKLGLWALALVSLWSFYVVYLRRKIDLFFFKADLLEFVQNNEENIIDVFNGFVKDNPECWRMLPSASGTVPPQFRIDALNFDVKSKSQASTVLSNDIDAEDVATDWQLRGRSENELEVYFPVFVDNRDIGSLVLSLFDFEWVQSRQKMLRKATRIPAAGDLNLALITQYAYVFNHVTQQSLPVFTAKRVGEGRSQFIPISTRKVGEMKSTEEKEKSETDAIAEIETYGTLSILRDLRDVCVLQLRDDVRRAQIQIEAGKTPSRIHPELGLKHDSQVTVSENASLTPMKWLSTGDSEASEMASAILAPFHLDADSYESVVEGTFDVFATGEIMRGESKSESLKNTADGSSDGKAVYGKLVVYVFRSKVDCSVLQKTGDAITVLKTSAGDEHILGCYGIDANNEISVASGVTFLNACRRLIDSQFAEVRAVKENLGGGIEIREANDKGINDPRVAAEWVLKGETDHFATLLWLRQGKWELVLDDGSSFVFAR